MRARILECETIAIDYLSSTGETYEITIDIPEEAGIPKGSELHVTDISELATNAEGEKYVDAAAEVLELAEEDVKYVKLLDIYITKDGEKVQPKVPVSVKIKLLDKDTAVLAEETEEADETANNNADIAMQVVHFGEAETAELECKNALDTVSFDTDGFSVFAFLGTKKITTTFLSADGKTLKVTVNYDEKAGIPEGAALEVSEIKEGEEGWMDRSLRLGQVLEEKYGKVIISDVRFLNIKIMVEGEEFQPLAPVDIKVEYEEEFDTDYTYDYVENDLDPKVANEGPEEKEKQLITVHYGQNGTEVLDSKYKEGEGCITESVASTSSFSDFDVVIISEDVQPEVKEVVGGYIAPLAAAAEIMEEADAPILRAAGDTPNHGKNLTNKGDGTYEIHLNVTGDADTTSAVSSVNVVVIYDASTSMNNYYYVPSATGRHGGSYPNFTTLYYRDGNQYRQLNNDNYSGTVYSNNRGTVYNGQRWNHQRRADAAEPVVRDFIDALYSYQDPNNPSNIQTSFITFNSTANTRVTWTQNASDITSLLTGNGNYQSFNSALYGSGTNWERALRAADTLVSNRPDDDPTYVIFITDGAPTQNATQTTTNTNYEQNYTAARDEALSIQTDVNSTNGDFFGIYAYGDEANWLSTMMYYANNGSEPPAGQRGEEFATKGYYTAADTESLTAAIGEIFDAIVETLGVTAVSIEDGTTSEVELSTGGGATADLLDVNTDSYQYTLSWNVTSNGDGTYSFTMPNKTTGEDVAYTVSVSGENITITWSGGSATYKGNVQFNVLTVEWTEATSFYNFAPPAAQFVDPDVTWNLSSVGTLLNGVTYDVAFECYPTQYTLDLIADLKNGYVEYSSLDENIRKYLQQSGDDYVLKTNTGATLRYTDTRTDDGPQSSEYNDPDPQSTAAAKSISVSKDWSNAIDSREKPESLTMHVTRDGVDRYELILNDAGNWTDEAFISYGIMTIHEGNIVLKTTGHEYSFSEPPDMEYYWELQVPTLRPMLINTVETLLVEVDASEAPVMTGDNATAVGEDGYTYYKLTINGTAEYYKVDEAIAHLQAENHRRSYLDVVKTVTGTNIPEGDVFPFTMTVTNSNAASGTAEDLNSDYWVWFSVYDTINGAMVISDDLVSGTGVNRETNASGYTGYYYAPSGTEISVNMQNGYSLRFLNLPSGSTYTVAENSIPADSSYAFVDIEKTRSYKETKDGPWIVDEDYTQTITDSQTISGNIELADSAYKVEVTNKYTTVDIQLEKVDENGEALSGSVFDLNKYGTSWINVQTDIKPGDTETSTTNPFDLGGLGIGRYQLVETKAPDGYIILTKAVYFEVYKDTDGVLKARLTDESGVAVTSPTDIAAIDGPGSGDTPIYTVTVTNTPGTALPNTGGPGTLLYTLSGLILLTGSVIGLSMRRRERRLN